MAFIQFTGVSLAFGERDIIKNASFFLKDGTRAALCGANGSGKTTFMKILAGIIKADSGDCAIEKGCHVSYLPQSGIVHKGRTLREEAELAFLETKKMLQRCTKIENDLANSFDDDSKTKAMLAELHDLNERVENSGYNLREKNITLVFKGLGFKESDLMRNAQEFSGGWQMRIALAKLILEKPDILLLDEPTNYLDIEAREFLTKWLCAFDGAYLLVSHDKYFLDSTVNEVYELVAGNLKKYAGNYSKYQAVRAQEMQTLIERYKTQQEEIAKSEDLIRRFRYKASKAAMVQERVKKLEKMERIEIPESLKKIAIRLPPPIHSGKIALTLENICKSYGENHVIQDLSITIESGEKLLVAGANGAGKSSLLRIIAGEDTAYNGKIILGAGIKIAYFTQEASESVRGTISVLEFIEQDTPTELLPKVRDMLGAFLFRGDDVYKILDVLSGGEKSRLALLKMLLKPVNMLVLDEPTNHLDLDSKDILQEALQNYSGTIIFVSHDRYFMDALAAKTLELKQGMHRIFYGNYAYYLEKVANETENKNENDHSSEVPKSQTAISAISTVQKVENTNSKEQREQNKKLQAEIRKFKNSESYIIKKIEDLETEKQNIEAALSTPEVYSKGDAVRIHKEKLTNVEAQIEKLNTEWELLNANRVTISV
ncbi:MAG: ABC-F family ATP-binding cassette domain-containing protein [Termitinemataceae bacterium]|nr:MAG: ABC-F family ATP-binding cassette domain-containing protein [Termitinemataceae bacterium]